MNLRDQAQKFWTKTTDTAARFLTPKEFRAVLLFLGIGFTALLWRGGKSLVYLIFPPAQGERFRIEQHRQDSIFAYLSRQKFNEDSLKFWSLGDSTSSSSSSDSSKTRSTKGKDLPPASINLNTASQDELQKLPGIGEVMSSRIIEYRRKHGKFYSLEELENVSGIGEKKFAKMKGFLKLE